MDLISAPSKLKRSDVCGAMFLMKLILGDGRTADAVAENAMPYVRKSITVHSVDIKGETEKPHEEKAAKPAKAKKLRTGM